MQLAQRTLPIFWFGDPTSRHRGCGASVIPLVNAGGEQCGGCVAAAGDYPGLRRPGRRQRRIAAIDGDVKAGLVELLFDIYLAGGLERQEPGAHPGKLREGHALLADVDGGAGEVRRGDVAVGGCCVAINFEKRALESDGANGGVDLEGAVEAGVMGAGQVREEMSRPGAAVAAVGGQAGVHAQGGAGGEGDDFAGGFKLFELGVVFDAAQAFGFVTLVLADEGFERAAEGRNKMDARQGLDGGVDGCGLGGDDCCSGTADEDSARGDAACGDGAAVAGHRGRIGEKGVGGVSSYYSAA